MSLTRISSLALVAMVFGFSACSQDSPPPEAATVTEDVDNRPVISRKDDLPRHTYTVSIQAIELFEPQNRQVLLDLAARVRTDVESDLDTYNITDDQTIRDFHAVLGSVALLEERWQDYLDILDRRRTLETKEANRLTMGLLGEAFAYAHIQDAPDVNGFVRDFLARRIDEMPYDVVQDNLESMKGRSEILSKPLVLGSIESRIQPVLDANDGEVSYDVVSGLVGVPFTLDYFIPSAGIINEVLGTVIAANRVEKKDIWEARKIAFDGSEEAEPVTIAVWDSGVDTDIFSLPSQLWRNEDEVADNGIDDDKNGFVDDVHGIAWSLHAEKETDLLYPAGEFPREEMELQLLVKGITDLQAAVESEEASAVRQELSQLSQDEVKDFIESLNMYGNYMHGTHVAGIAAEDNPFARVLVARITFGHTIIPELPTIEQAHADAAALVESIAYFKTNGVRAINMSWGGSLRGIENALEAHNAGGTPEERRALARKIYDIGDSAFRKAIQDAPEILFITSAGNSDNDVTFDEFYPSSYDYPNILSVGAVDSEGNETSFTSLGKVELYANGFEVESYVPGGNRLKLSGTSMASPQVLNLAGKLLALNPELTTSDLRRLILEGADTKQLESREIRLMNPKRSLELLEEAQRT